MGKSVVQYPRKNLAYFPAAVQDNSGFSFLDMIASPDSCIGCDVTMNWRERTRLDECSRYEGVIVASPK